MKMDKIRFDFTSADKIPLYNKTAGFGFVSEASALPSRKLNVKDIFYNGNGFTIKEDGSGTHTFYESDFHYNYGGLAFRADNIKPGAYKIKVGITDCSSENINISVNGTNPNRITEQGFWDAPRRVKIKNYAVWKDSGTFEYDFVSAEGYIEIETEPKSLPCKEKCCTAGLSYIEIIPLKITEANPEALPAIYVLGDSTEKTYTFEEAPMSGWGQLIHNMFDETRVNIINYSAGGRSMRLMYSENRFNDLLLTAKREILFSSTLPTMTKETTELKVLRQDSAGVQQRRTIKNGLIKFISPL
ncbi:MAG: hypothetical protein LUD77_05950 [Clostridiales bacterium]|nr:hypothetical protein [Clostridiales bacterium]